MSVDGGARGSSAAFEVDGMTPGAFVAALRHELAGEDLAVKVSASLGPEVLLVTVEGLGRSVLRYDLIPRQDGFSARLRSQRVAPLHLPFRRQFEERLGRLLARVSRVAAADRDRRA